MASPDEIWLVDFGDPFPSEPAFHRPAVVIGPAADISPRFPVVFVVPLTTTDRSLSFHVEIEARTATGLRNDSYAQCELLRSVSRQRLVHQIGTADAATGLAIATVLRRLFAW